MQFNSESFLFLFLPAIILFFFMMKKEKKGNVFLLFFSIVFYFWADGYYIYIIISAVVFNYFFGIKIGDCTKKKRRKFFFIFALSINISSLLFFKYTAFFIVNLNYILKLISLKPVNIIQIHLPLGISFFTFVSISYLVDIYFKRASYFKKIIDIGLFTGFFPKVMNGPITTAHGFGNQILQRDQNLEDFDSGVRRFISGLGKKVIIADTLSESVNAIFSIPANHLNFGISWLGIIFYSFQIYYDFSGYTDMAIGLGSMFGFHLPENFNYPYISESIKDFWKRWHISLGYWLQIYLFLPIAFSISGKIKKIKVFKIRAENWAYMGGALFTMFVCGLWHGAKWTFIIWGVYHGVFLILENLWIRKWLKRRKRYMRIFYSLFIIVIGWVIFRSKDLEYSGKYILSMFGMGKGDSSLYYPSLFLNPKIIAASIIAAIGSFPILKRIDVLIKKYKKKLPLKKRNLFSPVYSTLSNVIYAFLLIISILFISTATFNPFIYSGF